MATLFFLMAFVNTVMDTLKDTLVITAVGGGTQVIPFITGGWRRGAWSRLRWGSERSARVAMPLPPPACMACALHQHPASSQPHGFSPPKPFPVYGVLPASFAFLLAFSWGTQRLARRHLFNITISCFLCFLGGWVRASFLGSWELTAVMGSPPPPWCCLDPALA